MVTNYNQRLNGLNPLAYVGVNALQPCEFYTANRAPTTADSKGFMLGSEWLNTAGPATNQSIYVLVSNKGGVATWVSYGTSSAGDVLFLQGNTGGQVSPAVGGTINVVGDGTTISIAGNPGTNTLTASFIGLTGFTSVNLQVLTTTGTYTPTAGMVYCVVEAVGGGAGGGGSQGGATNAAAGGGGGAGAYARGFYTAAAIGASQAFTIGTGGAGGLAGNNAGTGGGNTTFGSPSTLTANGGTGGSGAATSNAFGVAAGGIGGTASGTGTFSTATGAAGAPGFSAGNALTAYIAVSGTGGSSIFGGGGRSFPTVSTTASFAGTNAFVYGSGGSGGVSTNTGADAAGGAGSAGVILVTEFIG